MIRHQCHYSPYFVFWSHQLRMNISLAACMLIFERLASLIESQEIHMI
jgi:hypothetical protein